MPIGKQKCISTATSTSRGLDRDDCRKTGTAMRHLVNTKELWRMLIHWMKYICTTGNCLHLKLKLFMTTVTLAQPKHVSNWPIVLSSARSQSDFNRSVCQFRPKECTSIRLAFLQSITWVFETVWELNQKKFHIVWLVKRTPAQLYIGWKPSLLSFFHNSK